MSPEEAQHKESPTRSAASASVHVLAFAIGGLFVGGLLGLAEGALWGLLILPVAPSRPSVIEITRGFAALCGAWGAVAGLPVFLTMALKARPLHDASLVFASAAKRAALGSFKGAFVGAPIGGMGLVLFMFAYNAATSYSTRWEQLCACLVCGTSLGALAGFTIGLCSGVSKGGEGEAKMQRLEADMKMYRRNVLAATETPSSEKLPH